MTLGDQVSVDESDRDFAKWPEINSAFKNRIKTGLITNLKHLDFDKLINNAKVLFVELVKKRSGNFT